MSYSISKFNGTHIATVQDGTIDTSLDIKLIGKSYAGYGQAQNENFVYLLENFANTTQPPNPLTGQIWFDSGNNKLKFYDGDKFRTAGGAEIGDVAPSSLSIGDFWFDTRNQQLSAWNGTSFTLIGPQGVSGAGTTQMQSVSVRDNTGGTHAIIKAIVNGNVIYTISADSEFTLDNTSNAINGFTKIYQGITLCNTNGPQSGVTTTDHRFFGTASNADKLGGYSAASYVKAGSAEFDQVVTFSDAGYTVGSQNIPKLKVYNDGSTTPTFESSVANIPIKFKTTTGSSTTVVPMQLLNADVLPGVTNVSNLGSIGLKWASIYAGYVYSTAQQADTLNVSGVYSNASTTNLTGTTSIVARDSNGNISVSYMSGIAEKADRLSYNGTYVVGSATSVASTVVIRDASANVAFNTASLSSITKTGLTGSGDIGQSNNKFGTVYANTFNGNLTGAVTGNTAGSHVGNVLANDSTVLIDANTKTFNGSINTSTGSIYAGNGSASNPSIGFNSDGSKDTGFYWISDGIIGITNNGVYSGRIDASHNLTIVNDVYCQVLHGTATSANYADLAEKYLADQDYEVGTVVMVGGEKEVTACKWGRRAIGAVSANPAYMMNSELEGGTYIALKGRVPVKVVGSIKKGDELIASDNGCAVMAVPHANGVFAIALESSDDTSVKLVECLIL